jgi:DMSO reductase family type II enzyme chaperone
MTGGPSRIRGDLYAALARAFQKPEAASGEDEDGSLVQRLERAALAFDARALGTAVESLVGALEITQDQAEEALRALEIAYNRLFVGPGRPEAPPYESFYRDRCGVLMGPAARDVERRYTEAGLALRPDHRDLPDHVATELGFMAYLAAQEAEADDEERGVWRDRERLFLQDHLCVWMPLLCRRVQEVSRHAFYTALAELSETFVRLDLQGFEPCHEPQPKGAIAQ